MRIHTMGEGPAVVLLHGTPTAPHHMDVLGLGLAGFQSVIVTMPGYDATPGLQPYTLARLHELLERELAPYAPIGVVGYSGGGYHALSLVLRRILPLRTAVVLAGAANFTPEEIVVLEPFLPVLRAGADLGPSLPDRMLSPKARANAAWRAEIETWARAVSPTVLADELDAAMHGPDLLPQLGALDLPVTFRVGTADVACPVSCSERAAKASREATLEVVQDVGHALLLEDPAGTIASVQRALDAVR